MNALPRIPAVTVAAMALCAALPSVATTLVAVTSGPMIQPSNLDLLTQSPTPGSPGSGQQPSQFALHGNAYAAPFAPDANVAWVQFEFDMPVLVNSVTVIQHSNGITALQHAYGDVAGSLSLGSRAVSGLYGEITGSDALVEFSSDPFPIDDGGAGTLHRFTVDRTSNPSGWASYRFYLDVSAVPEPATYGLMLAGVSAVGAVTTRRRRIRGAEEGATP